MKRSLLPKQVAASVWGIFLALAMGALLVFYLARPSGPRPPATPLAAVPKVDAGRIRDVTAELAAMRQREQRWGPAGSAAGPVVAPSPPVQSLSAGGDASGVSSLIVIQTARGTVAMLGGRTLRIGQRLETGDLVERIGKTFLVLKSPGGESRRIDMSSRFLLRPSRPNPETQK